MSVTQAVILCGGKGERLGEAARRTPKPLLAVGGRPVLDYILDNLEAAGVRRFILSAGYLGEQIRDYYLSAGRRAATTIETVIEGEPLGTAGAVRLIADRLDDDFVLAYGDVFTDFAVDRLLAEHEAARPLATLLVRASDHPWDSHLVETDASGRVVEFVHRRDPSRHYRNVANAAVYVLSRRIVDFIPAGRPSDFGADVFPAVVAAGGVLRAHVLEPEGFVKDTGTPERFAEVEEYVEERALAAAARAAAGPVETVFLDRDGVLSVERDGFVCDPDQLVLVPGAAEAVAMLGRAGIRCVVVTNQPVVARGLCSEDALDSIHRRLRELVAAAGGTLEAIYHCPHHPETHHGEGVAELRRACRCRKPSPGMLFRAQRELGLDLARCVMVGDRAADVRAARAAGIRAVLVGPSAARAREAEAAAPDTGFDSLLAFARVVAEKRDLPR
jgi:mannose-1-phosphate guanylyltransferase/phosphomannomutase